MPLGGIHGIEIVFLLLLLFVVVFGALARKLAIPYLIFLAFSVILVTLVLQGLTLPPLIRALGVAGASSGRVPRKERHGERYCRRP